MSLIIKVIKKGPLGVLKNESIRKNLINSLYYFGGTFFQFIVAIFTQPVFSRYLELKDFAVIGYYSSIQALLLPMFNMSLPFFFMAQYWKDSNGKQNLSFILNFLNISNGIFSIVAFIFINLYFKIINVTMPLVPFIFIILINLFFDKYKTFYLLECRVTKQGLKFFLLNFFQILTNTIFSLFLVVLFHGGASGRMGGVMFGIVCLGIVSMIFMIKENVYHFSFSIDKEKVKIALKYCVPLIIGSYAYYPIGNIDCLFLERIGNVSEFGYYNIGLTISGFVSSFLLAFYQSFEPDLYRLLAQKKYKQYLVFVFFYIVVVAIISLLFILISNPIVSYLTAGRFLKAALYANVFIIGIFFMQIGGIFEQIFTSFGATKYVMWRNILMGTFCVFAFYYMINKYQFYGANITRVITSLFYILIGAFLLFIYYIKLSNKRKRILMFKEND